MPQQTHIPKIINLLNKMWFSKIPNICIENALIFSKLQLFYILVRFWNTCVYIIASNSFLLISLHIKVIVKSYTRSYFIFLWKEKMKSSIWYFGKYRFSFVPFEFISFKLTSRILHLEVHISERKSSEFKFQQVQEEYEWQFSTARLVL